MASPSRVLCISRCSSPSSTSTPLSRWVSAKALRSLGVKSSFSVISSRRAAVLSCRRVRLLTRSFASSISYICTRVSTKVKVSSKVSRSMARFRLVKRTKTQAPTTASASKNRWFLLVRASLSIFIPSHRFLCVYAVFFQNLPHGAVVLHLLQRLGQRKGKLGVGAFGKGDAQLGF